MLVVVEQLDTTTRCSDRGPLKVGHAMKINKEIDGVVHEVIYDMEKFSCDQLRKLCGHISLLGYGSYNKFKCYGWKKKATRKEHLELLKSGVFSSGTAKTIKESMLESL
jgi:hypothetical protein